jgi:circadian clock protein KaiB
MPDQPPGSSEAFDQGLQNAQYDQYLLRLYVTGRTENSIRAIQNIREICETHLAGRYSLEIIDIYQQPELAREAQIVAAPTLIKQLPNPLRRIVGNLSRTDRVLVGLDLVKVK